MQSEARAFRGGVLFAAAVLLAACGGGSSGGSKPQPPLQPGWNAIYPGGNTHCADGSTYAFFVRPAPEGSPDANKLVVEFEGGGACWNTETCAIKTYTATVNVAETLASLNAGHGIEDFDNPENPYQDWNHVFIPYCTGDVHAGDNTYTYSQGLTVSHNGQNNVHAVLDWTYGEFTDIEQVSVTGCSAGSVGSIIWAPWVFAHYKDTATKPSVQFGDSFVGYTTEEFFYQAIPRWNGWAAFFSEIPAFNYGNINTYRTDYFAWVYIQSALAFPDARFSQFLSILDLVETVFCYLGGGGVVPLDPFAGYNKTLEIGGSCSSPLFCEYNETAGSNQCCLDLEQILAGNPLSALIQLPIPPGCFTLIDVANLVGLKIPPELENLIDELFACNTDMDCLKLPNPIAWNSYMGTYLSEIEAATWPTPDSGSAAAATSAPNNFYAFVSQGICHCTIPSDYFYAAKTCPNPGTGCDDTEWVYLHDWLSSLVDDSNPPDDYRFVSCGGASSADALTCIIGAAFPCLGQCGEDLDCLLECLVPIILPTCGN